jgi:hypothetical protein
VAGLFVADPTPLYSRVNRRRYVPSQVAAANQGTLVGSLPKPTGSITGSVKVTERELSPDLPGL